MDEDLYDEFGNYIGPDINEDSSDEERRRGDRSDEEGDSVSYSKLLLKISFQDVEDHGMRRDGKAKPRQARDSDEGSQMRDEDEDQKDEEYYQGGY